MHEPFAKEGMHGPYRVHPENVRDLLHMSIPGLSNRLKGETLTLWLIDTQPEANLGHTYLYVFKPTVGPAFLIEHDWPLSDDFLSEDDLEALGRL